MDSLQHIICERRTYSHIFDSHAHTYCQMLFPLEGQLDLETERREIRLKPDQMLYIPPGHEHRFRSLERNECLVLDIPAYFFKGSFDPGVLNKLDSFWTSIRFLLTEETKQQSAHSLLKRYKKTVRMIQLRISAEISQRLFQLKSLPQWNITIRRIIPTGLKSRRGKARKLILLSSV
ncbi:Cupin domain protein [Bacillus amyloliquefaciens]|nr:Cupin domain protein [Bacillus amyloliquefaciens]